MTDAAVHSRCFALIPCAGSGSRAGASGPKQYEALAGRPLVMHTLAAFVSASAVDRVLVVVAPGDRFFADLPLSPAVTVADCGGQTRARTVGNGLQALSRLGAQDDDWVLVHDAARCLVTASQIDVLVAACRDDPVGGLLALPLPDTLKASAGGRVRSTLDRSDKWLAQTPQMFRLGLLRQALAHAGDRVTDESSAVEALGLSPRLVQGSASNFKVTWPEDFALAGAVLDSRS